MNPVVQRILSRPEFGPFVLLVAMVFVFWQINPAFLSSRNIGNMLAFTVELGLIALAMTLLMTSGEFDLSVGSLFGFCPVLMWTLYNTGVTSIEVGFVPRLGHGSGYRPVQRLVRHALADSLVLGDARHVAGCAGQRTGGDERVSAADLGCRGPLPSPRC